MDCKMENAARSLVRIECILIQGFIREMVILVGVILMIPFIPFSLTKTRFSQEREKMRWWKRMLMIPVWFGMSILFTAMVPFLHIAQMIRDLKIVVGTEWANRWRTGSPKTPDGHPLAIPTEEHERAVDAAVMLSVLRDYNEEAKRYGQGIDIPPIG